MKKDDGTKTKLGKQTKSKSKVCWGFQRHKLGVGLTKWESKVNWQSKVCGWLQGRHRSKP
jgi:hypothetical protein